MQQPNMCALCEGEPGDRSCPMCGRLAGQRCWDVELNLCSACAEGRRAATPGMEEPVADEQPDEEGTESTYLR